MAYFALSGITGCISPVTGTSESYDVMYNAAFITTYHKKDIFINFTNIYMVCIVFENKLQQFQFLTITDRDNFYNTLPI